PAPDRRVALHRAILRRLRDQPSQVRDVARLAHHAEAAGDGDAVLEFAPKAAERASALGSHREAAEQLARALRYAESLSMEEQARLYEQRAYELHLTDQLDEALVAAREALEKRQIMGQRRQEGETLVFISRLSGFLGRPDEAEEAGHAAVATLRAPTASSVRATVYGMI